jgi:type IX secretion system PorP/SprF family membrane protein
MVVLVLVFCSVFEKQAKAQEYPWSLQYVTNMQIMNPAFVGMWDKSGLMVSTRTNWVGINGAPLSQYVGYFTPVKDQKSGVGVNIQRLNTGLEKRLSLSGDYSYQIRLDMYNYLRLGLRVGILNYDNNLSSYLLYPDHIPDPEFNPDIRFYNMTTFGVGGVFYNDHLYVSFSVPQVINNTFRVNRNNFNSSLASPKTAYLSGSYVFSLVNGIHLRPNLLMVATIGKPVYFDVAALVYLPSNLQLGLNIRTTGSVCFSAQYTFKNNIRIGYASDYAIISDIRKYQVGTYEFVIGYDINTSKRKYSKPNYF